MLKVGDLEDQIKSALENTIPKAIETCKLGEFPEDSDMGKEHAKKCADTFKELVCADLAKLLASAIDYYVKNISITGTILTVGSPAAQQAVIAPAPTPAVAGVIPNTLGIK